MSIKFDISSSGTQYYTDLSIKHFREEHGYTIYVKKYLQVSLICPVAIKDAAREIAFKKWDGTYNVILKKCKRIDIDYYEIVFVIRKEAHDTTFSLDYNDSIELYLNDPYKLVDLSKDLSSYWKTIAITVDGRALGFVDITADKLEDKRLKNMIQYLDFVTGTAKKTIIVPVGSPTRLRKELLQGIYHISPRPLINADMTVEADVFVHPQKIEVKPLTVKEVKVSYGALKYYSAVDFSITGLPELSLQHFDVAFSVGKEYAHHLHTKQDVCTQLRRLPASGMLEIKIASITLNNKRYDFSIPAIPLENERISVVINADNVKITDLTHDKTAKLSIDLKTDRDFAGQYLKFNLQSAQNHYEFLVEVKAGEQKFPVAIAYGDYEVRCDNFINDRQLYVVEVAETLQVNAAEVTLPLKTEYSVTLSVRGFTRDKLTFGAFDNHIWEDFNKYLDGRAYSICSYVSYHPDQVLERDDATENTIVFAHKLETAFKKKDPYTGPHKVLPIMASYTANLSKGDISVLENREKLKNSLLNYITTLTTLMNNIYDKRDLAGAIILNPNMLSACMVHNLAPTHAMPVKSVLDDVMAAKKDVFDKIAKRKPIFDIHEGLTDDIKGYVRVLNWLTTLFSPEISYGWHVNIWDMDKGDALWIYGDSSPKEIAYKVANYVKTLGVYDRQFKPDFLAINRFDADDFTSLAIRNSYCYGPREWKRYFDFCGHLSHALKTPVMPWQIPASHTPVLSEDVKPSFERQCWGTAGTYIFGDPKLGNNVENIHPTIRDFSFSKNRAEDLAKLVGDTPGLMYSRAGAFNVSKPAYHDFPLRGIFHIQLGGEFSLGMAAEICRNDADVKWANKKLVAYDENPVEFRDSLLKK